MVMEWLRRPWSRKASYAAQSCEGSRDWAMLTGWGMPSLSRGYEASVREAYMRNVIAQRSVRMVAEAVGLIRFAPTAAATRVAVVLERPNPQQTQADLLERLASMMLLAGECFLEVVSGPDGQPYELYALRPERMTLEPGPSGWPAAYVYKVGASAARFPVDRVTGAGAIAHIKTYHPLDDHRGLSPLEAARLAVETHNAAAVWNIGLLKNAARPSGALIFKSGDGASLSGEQFERLKLEMEAGFSGAQNAGRPLLLDGGLSWQPLSMSPADMDFLGARSAAAREIALAFGVPPMLLGLPGDNSYANYQEANRAFWRLTVLPLAQKIASGVAVHLRHWWPEAALEVDKDGIPALALDRERLWAQVSAADFLTDDEKRRMVGLEPREDGKG